MVNVTDELASYFTGETSFDIACSNAIKVFLDVYKIGIFICDVCGEIIYPKVTTNKHGIFIKSEKARICDRLGNYVIKKHVCKNCLKEDKKENLL